MHQVVREQFFSKKDCIKTSIKQSKHYMDKYNALYVNSIMVIVRRTISTSLLRTELSERRFSGECFRRSEVRLFVVQCDVRRRKPMGWITIRHNSRGAAVMTRQRRSSRMYRFCPHVTLKSDNEGASKSAAHLWRTRNQWSQQIFWSELYIDCLCLIVREIQRYPLPIGEQRFDKRP